MLEESDQSSHRGGWSLGHHADRPVLLIADPAVQPQICRNPLGRIAIADTLDSTCNGCRDRLYVVDMHQSFPSFTDSKDRSIGDNQTTVTDLQTYLATVLDSEVVAMAPVGGGDVADAYRVMLADSTQVFAKTKTDAPVGFFVTEAAGLRWLREPGAVSVPKVIAVSDRPPALVLEWIESGYPNQGTEAAFGHSLARLHQAGAPSFGREDRRSTGSRGLPNEPYATWAEFYASQRLLPLARLAADANALPEQTIRQLESVAARIDDRCGPAEPPARLHGDLWAGNRLIGDGGVSWIIDPAVFGGHREFDLSMMRLFGGYGLDCFAAYEEITPLADGWATRIPLHQLAPLVVHSIKFGGPYVSATQEALAALL